MTTAYAFMALPRSCQQQILIHSSELLNVNVYAAKRVPYANLKQKEQPLSSKKASQLLPVKL
jgi:hypothetical protein